LKDAENFKAIMDAANVIGLPKDEQKELIDIVASVLHFGNVSFGTDENGKGAVIENEDIRAISEVFINFLNFSNKFLNFII
jgi:myosin-1